MVGKKQFHKFQAYLLLFYLISLCESNNISFNSFVKIKLSVHLIYESEMEDHFGQKSVAILLKLKDSSFHWVPDIIIDSANLTLNYLENFHFNCGNPTGNQGRNVSVISSNLMGPMWNTIFQNLRHPKSHTKNLKGRQVKDTCNSMSIRICDDAGLEDLIPVNPEIIPLNYYCPHSEGNQVQVDVSPILKLWYSKSQVFDSQRGIGPRSAIFSVVINQELLKPKVINVNDTSRIVLKSTPKVIPPTSKLVLHMGYTVDTRCFTEDFVDYSYVDDHDDRDGILIKVCKFRQDCPEKDCGILCDFEDSCEWKWDKGQPGVTGFQLTNGKNVTDILRQNEDPIYDYSGPQADSQNDTQGHFLLLAFTETVNKSAVYHLKSPWFDPSDAQCYLEAMLHMNNMNDGTFKFLMHTQNHTTWVPLSKLGNNKNMWERLKSNIGKTTQRFHISLEVIPSSRVPSHIAVDNIRLVNCFPQPPTHKTICSQTEFRCRNDLCIERSRVCDFSKDCLYGEDEENCDIMPKNTSCNFEKGWCGWTGVSEKNIKWERTNKPSQTKITGPSDGDHTFDHIRNVSGYYLYVNMNANHSHILDKAMLRSAVFAPPPFYHQNLSSNYFKSCELRFFYHMFGPHVGSLHVDVIEGNPRYTKSTRLATIIRDQGNMWHRKSIPLPKLDHLYYIEFVVTRGPRFAGDIALDDISLSPECVGQRVSQADLKGYSYENELNKRRAENRSFVESVDMANVTKYTFTTCNNSGRIGPTPEQCESAYKETHLNSSVTVLTDEGRAGVQMWTVPESKHYTFVAKGASGGRGAVSSTLLSSGSMVKVTVLLKKGEQIFILVGQEGASVCEQRNTSLPLKLRETCRENLPHGAIGRMIRAPRAKDSISELNRMSSVLGGGGGGGGATFVFKMEGDTPTLLLIAAGGGGLAYNANSNISPYGGGTNGTLEPRSGSSLPHGAGGGGGWKGEIIEKNMDVMRSVKEVYRILGTQRGPAKDNSTMWISAGSSFINGGGIGGLPCIDSARWGTEGGFGGGGGGCTAGGGGGGFVGGSANTGLSSNGEGGLSYVTKSGLYPSIDPGGNDGQGSVVVIPSIIGCGCDYRCVLLDEYRFHSACVCPENKMLSKDGYSCSESNFKPPSLPTFSTSFPLSPPVSHQSGGKESPLPLSYLIGLIVIGVVIFASIGLLCIFLYNRYQRRKAAILRRKVLGGPELQLSRLRAASGPGGVLTEYNPNYEFGGETYSVADLKEIPRENLRLIKALGQGAFGEVYQGFYKHRAGDTVEMPVAVKTLPELSSNQAEMDFLMEALIMSKFNHPNIVHFIGVCFDKHPRFIILELLAGGDLKTFLRESRPKPERGTSTLAMKDLLLCAIDVAKGCKYLEDNHFIHRDIAARNCLLTSKGPGRVVKIADFGMARDIYRADYYKKGGKAMLPVKWMPPEAFLDGLFTSKTDVWSYGVLLWEVFSLGYMPYPGRGNQDVMQLVTNGGRLEPPSNCPPPVYGIMTQCWHPIPEERPTFSTLLERVGYCLQDPEVVNAPLPVFQRPPSSSERDTTIMRPLNPDDQSCLRIVHRSNASSMSTVPPSPNSSTADYLVPLAPYSFSTSNRINNGNDSQVTSPTSPSSIPESESTQTLLEDDGEEGPVPKPSTNIYNSTKLTNQSSAQRNKKPNGIENGLTLNPSNLDKTPKNPVPYANVGVKKPGKNIDEEIRC